MKVKFWHKELSNIQTKDIGEGTIIHSHCWIGKNVKIGKRCKIQAFTFIPDGVEIKDDVFIGPRATFTNDAKLQCKGKDFWEKTLVKKGVKIGAGVLIKAGIIIDENVVIGMGAVVLEDVPKGEVWVGNPAHKIK